MIKIDLKPLSVNEAYKGRRFKTDKYNRFTTLAMLMLPSHVDIPNGRLRAFYEFGLSSKNADNDNPVKPFQDILQRKYGFNDKMIYQAVSTKVDVPKGKEFIQFRFENYE